MQRSSLGRRIGRWTVAVAVFAMAWSPSAAFDEAEIRAAVDAVYENDAYQQRLPGVDEPLPQPEPVELEPKPEPVRLDWLDDLLEPVAYMLLIVAAGYIVFSILRHGQKLRLRPRRTDIATNADDAVLDSHGSNDPAQARFADAERLAQQGAYGEAIHALLLIVVEIMRQRYDTIVRPALTARELVHAIELESERRHDFANLVGAAELGHFGGRNVGHDVYTACQSRAERLIATLARG